MEFRVEVGSDPGHPLFVRGSFNRLAGTLGFSVIHRGLDRIYELCLGGDHHNPDCVFVGERHKHAWHKTMRDKRAYAPIDITALAGDPLAAWAQFCAEAKITHRGSMHPPPALQLDLV
ncbi:MAG: hypothetical protein FJX56_09965 [Alphaproteobacteria bacterium]|nr:hypothetical protein [Alphaproteobacteria bacterium]